MASGAERNASALNLNCYKDFIMGIKDGWHNSDKNEQAENEAWTLGDYISEPCVNCGRNRVCECANGKTRCEKCNWVEADNGYCPKAL